MGFLGVNVTKRYRIHAGQRYKKQKTVHIEESPNGLNKVTLEILPAEILQEIFILSCNLDLPQTTHLIARKLRRSFPLELRLLKSMLEEPTQKVTTKTEADGPEINEISENMNTGFDFDTQERIEPNESNELNEPNETNDTNDLSNHNNNNNNEILALNRHNTNSDTDQVSTSSSSMSKEWVLSTQVLKWSFITTELLTKLTQFCPYHFDSEYIPLHLQVAANASSSNQRVQELLEYLILRGYKLETSRRLYPFYILHNKWSIVEALVKTEHKCDLDSAMSALRENKVEVGIRLLQLVHKPLTLEDKLMIKDAFSDKTVHEFLDRLDV